MNEITSLVSEPDCTWPLSGPLPVDAIRRDFPILQRTMPCGKPLVYLDSAARSQMPLQVLDAVREFDLNHNANVHRGIHTLSEEATDAYECAREKVAHHLGVSDPAEIVFVRNATEGINLISYAWGLRELSEGDEIVLSVMEHHSNLVPWQLLSEHKGVVLKHIPITPEGELNVDAGLSLITPRTKIVSLLELSNVIGTVNNLDEFVKAAHDVGAIFLCDGSQSAAHMPMNLSEKDYDFFVASGYKMLAPTGIGVLWGRGELLERMEPFLAGGSMIEEVELLSSTWAPVPQKFEAGTPNISGAIGLAAAALYVDKLGRERALEHEKELISYTIRRLDEIGGVEVYGRPRERASAVSFNITGMHPHDTSSILDSEGVAVRAGHHCAQPLHAALGVDSSARVSFHCYNTRDDVDRFVAAVEMAKELFAL